jgi:hypothetical protein
MAFASSQSVPFIGRAARFGKLRNSAIDVSAQQGQLVLFKSRRTAYRIPKPWDVLILTAADEEKVFP